MLISVLAVALLMSFTSNPLPPTLTPLAITTPLEPSVRFPSMVALPLSASSVPSKVRFASPFRALVSVKVVILLSTPLA